MGKNKKRNKWNNQPRKQQNPLAQTQQMVAPRTVRNYWANELTEQDTDCRTHHAVAAVTLTRASTPGCAERQGSRYSMAIHPATA